MVPQPCSVHQCPVQLISLCTFPGRSSSSWLTSSTAGPPRIPSSPGCAMSLAKWMGFGSAQSASNGHASTPNTATESAKTGTISKADYKQFGLENVSVIMFFTSEAAAHNALAAYAFFSSATLGTCAGQDFRKFIVKLTLHTTAMPTRSYRPSISAIPSESLFFRSKTSLILSSLAPTQPLRRLLCPQIRVLGTSGNHRHLTSERLLMDRRQRAHLQYLPVLLSLPALRLYSQLSALSSSTFRTIRLTRAPLLRKHLSRS